MKKIYSGCVLMCVVWSMISFSYAEDRGSLDLKALGGFAEGEFVGRSLRNVGDLDGDGLGEVAVSLYDRALDKGRVHVISGAVGEGSRIFRAFVGNSEDFGFAVEGLGDVNGDGYDDLAISSPFAESLDGVEKEGAVYVLWGGEAFFSSREASVVSEDTVGGDVGGYVIFGGGENASFGTSLGVADFNGDGESDVLVSAFRWDQDVTRGVAGGVYVLWGGKSVSQASLSDLLSSGDALFLRGGSVGESAGWSLKSLGDVNRDGRDDIVIGAPGFDRGRGKVYVVMGQESWGREAELRNVGRSVEGLQLEGDGASEEAGWFVDGGGDVNGDGFPDMIIGSRGSLGSGGRETWGRMYVIYGKSSFVVSGTLSSVGKSLPGYVLYSKRPLDDLSGEMGGDMNGDGFEDILLGATGSEEEDDGVYVVYGGTFFEGSEREFREVGSEGFPGLSIEGKGLRESGRVLVSGGGDVNGDGLVDAFVGIPFVRGEESDDVVRLVHNKLTGRSVKNRPVEKGRSVVKKEEEKEEEKKDVVVNDLPSDMGVLESVRGRVFVGTKVNMRSGYALSSAGDIDGDGLDEVMVSAVYDSELNRERNGGVYVFYGRKGRDLFRQDVGDSDGVNSFSMWGAEAGDRSGWSLGGGGDVNGDGYDDMVVGVPYSRAGEDAGVGRVHIIFGRAYEMRRSMDLGEEEDGLKILTIEGLSAGDRTGWSVSLSEDMNGDGLDDVIIGVPHADSSGKRNSGRVVVMYGAKDLSSLGRLSIGDVGRSVGGFVVEGEEEGGLLGWSVASAGDVDGDGKGDMVLGEPGGGILGSSVTSEELTFGGRVTIMRGEEGGFSYRVASEKKGDGWGYIVSGGGDVNGDGFSDVIVGKPRGGSVGTGLVYVVSGKKGLLGRGLLGRGREESLQGGDFVVFEGEHLGSRFGHAVTVLEDMNGDGLSELLIGSPGYGDEELRRGAGYVVLGRKDWGGEVKVGEGEGIYRMVGSKEGEELGLSVSSVGDFDGDGVKDFVVGTYYSDPDGVNNAGIGYLVYGVRALSGR